MHKQRITWVLVADGTRARIFEKGHRKLNNVMGQDLVSENLQDRDINMDKPGRGYDSATSIRQTYQPRTDWHEHNKDLFAKKICSFLDKACETADFDDLVIISPPKMLGGIRNYLDKQILSKIKAEIPKDISKLSEYELMHYLETSVAV